MIKHIVMWQLKETALGNSKVENAQKVKTMLEKLKTEIEGLIEIEVGINICDSEQSYDVVLYSEFMDESALENYHVHPKHLEAGRFISEVRTERAVVDYRIKN